jgi:hypothetical protein
VPVAAGRLDTTRRGSAAPSGENTMLTRLFHMCDAADLDIFGIANVGVVVGERLRPPARRGCGSPGAGILRHADAESTSF